MNELAKIISDISKKEPGLLYYFPEEISKSLEKGRGVVLKAGGDLIGFIFWDIYGNLAEVHTIYISPKFRGQGAARKLLEATKKELAGKVAGAFLFTLSPAIIHLIKEYGFRRALYFSLPLKIWLKILRHRLHPRRWLSYLKYFRIGFAKFQLYIS